MADQGIWALSQPTTAVSLGSLYRELIDEGIPEQLAIEITRDASKAMTADGRFRVKAAS